MRNIMKIKNIKAMDFYEVLNVGKSASHQEIERAYYLGKTTYRPKSLASYSLLSEEERQLMLQRIEKAFMTLGDPEKRRLYDLKTFDDKFISKQNAYFRKSTQKLVIEDVREKKGIWKKFKALFFR